MNRTIAAIEKTIAGFRKGNDTYGSSISPRPCCSAASLADRAETRWSMKNHADAR